MAYTPKQWVCGETITVDALNHMERALEELADGYVPTQWQAGDVITADKLNKIEQAIADAYTEGCKDESNLIGRTLSGLYVNSTVSVIGSCAFRGATDLEAASFPNVTIIQNEAFALCDNLSEIYIPNVVSVKDIAFKDCGLKSFNAPLLESIGSKAFQSCSHLETVSFPQVTTISSSAFYGCSNLMSVYILGSSVPSLYTNVFTSTPMETSQYTGSFGSIFVPASLVTTYQSAPRWSAYYNRITAYIE